ncbi:S1/P1 nuclease [Mucilaginibacter ginsenosidivorans]|uniref:S1/P1 nuclease n=1 Tax=Mucilaginibacter ginsenosidivorans TaxID=398053 RepID=A0A5B8UR36_9SPHI|nr:S1/P1 nuclease [Mucilaginibacter ginsenosidivorans]QEC61449.1 S1/P1 nuclease [Mucilaginibacter ginsenosidivorans]
MKTRFLKKLALILAIIYLPLQSMAWGTQGHRIAGQIADSYLSPKARKAIEAILGDESIAMASNWADFIKSDPAYNYLYNWHFIDLDKAYTYPELQAYLNQDTAVDAYTKLQFLIGELKKKDLDKDKKLLYLRMLIHIVEDVHQPLHTGHTEDKGGNDIKVTWFSNNTNLHSVWDSQLIDFQQLSYIEYSTAINHTTAAERSEWQKAPISEWLFESNQLAEKLYSETKNGDALNGYKYNFNHIDTLNQQLLKAGVRLAGVLNDIFG